MLMTKSKMRFQLKKSRLAGFFLLVLLQGCEPHFASKTDDELFVFAEVDGNAALELASRRLSKAQYGSALRWQLQALRLGQTHQLNAYVTLLEREQGFYAAASFLSHWQQTEPMNAPLESMQHDALLQRSELLKRYGLWQQATATLLPKREQSFGLDLASGTESFVAVESQPLVEMRSEPSSAQSLSAPDASCALTLKPVVQTLQGEMHWQHLQRQWQQDSAMRTLAVCFAPVVRVESLALRCGYESKKRVSCEYSALAPLLEEGGFSQFVVIGGQGLASYNNGLLQLSEQSSYDVFRHEFAHVLGLMDEYELPEALAKEVCSKDDIPNLVMDLALLSAHQKRFAHQLTEDELTPVGTCLALGQQAYALSKWSVMRSHEATLSALYVTLMRKQLEAPEQIMPVQYYFAYLARKNQDALSWQRYMRQAALLGYPDALRLWAEFERAPNRAFQSLSVK